MEFTFGEIYDNFLSIYSGNIKLVDLDTGDTLYQGDVQSVPNDYDDCEVNFAKISGRDLVIEITYSFHRIQY